MGHAPAPRFVGYSGGAPSLRTDGSPVGSRAGGIHRVSVQVSRQKKNHPSSGPSSFIPVISENTF